MNSSSSVLAGKLRSQVRSSDSRIRLEVLKGAFDTDRSAAAATTRWKSPSWKLLVFVSSPFTDTQQERSFLVDEYQFELRRVGQEYGVQVIFVDMRWGIQDQNTINHKTWEECAKVIEWCKLESMGVAFLSLQGNKYGYTPLPRVVMESDMLSHLSASGCSEEVRELIFDWYHIDDNSVPERRYFVLRNLAGVDDSDYWNAFGKILPVLSGLPFDTTNYDGLCVGKSVTEWEVRAALDSYPCQLDKSEGICWSFRNFSGDIIDDKSFCDFEATSHDSTESKWNSLISFMKDQIPSENVNECSLTFSDFKLKDSARYLDYFEHFKDFVASRFSKSLDGIIHSQTQWNDDGMGVGLCGVKLSEMLHHCNFAKEKCSTFIGREVLVQSVLDEVLKENRQIGEKYDHLNPKHRFLGVCVSVIGVSGAGKTALMAKVASEYFKIKPEESIVIIRFCGTSPGSVNARRLMTSICAQIELLCGVPGPKSDDLAFRKYDDVVTYFQSLLHDYPVILFIDSLDQLTDENQGRSQISFLKGVEPHPKTRIVVSCLPDEREVNVETGVSYLYLCETRLREALVPRVVVTMTASRAVEESMDIVDSLLKRQGRTLQHSQREIVQEKIAGVQEKTALYITLSVAVISKWTSDTDAVTALPGSVVDLIEHLFLALEVEFGQRMTRLALAVLTFARKGISDIEMEDVLSMSEDVLDSVFTYHTPTVRRLPTHVWLRLKGAMDGLIVEGDDGCFVWYHRQLRETAAKVYYSEKLTVHFLMAHYFGNLRDGGDTSKISRQPWVFRELPFHSDSVPNRRRCCEASHHMILSGLVEEAERELCDFEGICSKLRCGEGFQLIREIVSLIEVCKLSGKKPSERLQHYYRWLRQDIHFLSKNTLARFVASASEQPKISVVRKEASKLENIRQVRTLGTLDSFGSMLSALEGHGDFVNSVSFSPDGRTLASGSDDCTVRVWDVATGEEKAKLEGHSDHVISVAFNPDGYTVASGSKDRTIRVWDAATGEEKAKLEGHSDYVNSVAFNPDGKLLASGSSDRFTQIWDVATGERKSKLEHGDSVLSVAFSPDGLTLASGSNDLTILVMDVATGKKKMKLEEHSGSVNSVAFSPGGKTLASASSSSILVWDVPAGEEKAKLEGHLGSVVSVAFNSDGMTLASGSVDRTIRVWDLDTGQARATLEGHSHYVISVAFSSDDNTLASASSDRTIRVWNIAREEEKAKLEGHKDVVWSLAFSPDGETLATGSRDRTTLIWSIATGDEISKLEGHRSDVESVSFSPDSKTVASGSRDGTIRLWDVATGETKAKLKGCDVSLTSVAFSPDGKTVASVSVTGSIRLWDVAIGEEKVTWERHSDDVKSIAFSPDGKNLAFGSVDRTIRVWDVATGEEKVKLEGHCGAVRSVAFGPFDNFLASGSNDQTIRVWDVATGLEKTKLEGHSDSIFSVAFSPDGMTLVSGSRDESIRVWVFATGEEKAKLEGHRRSVTSVAFSPDGKTVASGSDDRTIRVWDVATREEKASLRAL